jgi:hypothetical protein
MLLGALTGQCKIETVFPGDVMCRRPFALYARAGFAHSTRSNYANGASAICMKAALSASVKTQLKSPNL